MVKLFEIFTLETSTSIDEMLASQMGQSIPQKRT